MNQEEAYYIRFIGWIRKGHPLYEWAKSEAEFNEIQREVSSAICEGIMNNILNSHDH